MPVNHDPVRRVLTTILRELRESPDEEYADDFDIGRELDSIQILQLIAEVHAHFGLLYGQDTTDITLLDRFSFFSDWVRDHAKDTV